MIAPLTPNPSGDRAQSLRPAGHVFGVRHRPSPPAAGLWPAARADAAPPLTRVGLPPPPWQPRAAPPALSPGPPPDEAGFAAAFVARRPWWGGDLQTLRNYLWLTLRHPPRPAHRAERVEVPLMDGTGDRLSGLLLTPEQARSGPLVLLIHGMGGCEASGYMEETGTFMLAAGLTVLLLNLRGAGPSRPLCRRFYHPGGSEDLRALMRGLPPATTAGGVVAVGFSLGGHVLLKYLGEPGVDPALLAAVTVSAPLDLDGASRRLLARRNWLYHSYLLGHVKRGLTAPGAELDDDERRVVLAARGLRGLDDAFTAPRHGFADASAYYAANSCLARLPDVRVPTLLIHAKNDPFVPVEPYLDVPWRDRPALTPVLPESGGHLGFHGRHGPWHLGAIQAFLAARGVGTAPIVDPPTMVPPDDRVRPCAATA